MTKKNIVERTCTAGAHEKREIEAVYAGKAMVYEDNTVKVIPNRPRENMVKPVRRWGYYSIDDEGYIVVTPRARKDRSRAIRLKSTLHGSLSKTADGAFLLMMKVYEDEALDFKSVMKKEIKEALK